MKINGQFVMSIENGLNMLTKLTILRSIMALNRVDSRIFIAKANLEEKGLYSYVGGTKEVLDLDDVESCLKFEKAIYVGYCGNENVYLYK